MKKNRVLVIGGAGFIGRNIVSNLLNNGYEPVIYDIVKSNLPVEQYSGDLLIDDRFKEILGSCDMIIYLITSVSPKKSMLDPNSAYTIDIPLLIKTLDVCLEKGIKRIIYSSSGGTVYGEGVNRPFVETDGTSPINHYAICKLSCEKILNLYNKLYGMENIVLRIANPYGMGQNPKSGVGVITTFATDILNGNSITLYGDGKIYRDYVDIESVSEAFRLCCDWKFNKDVKPTFNIGSGEVLSLNEIIDIISLTYEKNVEINYLPARPFDVKYSALNIDKACQYLNYQRPDNQPAKIKKYVLALKNERKN